MKTHISISLAVFACYLPTILGGSDLGPLPSAFLYDNAHSYPLEYVKDPEGWSDIASLIGYEGFFTLKQLVFTGTFLVYLINNNIFYPGESSIQDIDIILISGINISYPIGSKHPRSIQLATSYDRIFTPSMMLYYESYFQGRSFPVTKRIWNLGQVFPYKVDSFIIHGKSDWTIVTKGGKKYCLQPQPKQGWKFPICMLLERKYNFQASAWQSIYIGCDTAAEKNRIPISTCFEFGAGLPHYDAVSSVEEDEGEYIPPPSILSDCKKNDDFLTLLDLRINADFSSEYQMGLPKNKNLAWRTELLDTSFEIVMATCPPALVSPDYYSMLREIYIFMAEKLIWSKGEGWPPKKTMDTKMMVKEADKCLLRLQANPHDHNQARDIESQTFHYYMSLDTPKYNESDIRTEFMNLPDKDIVLESVWLISNHVAAICHLTFEFTTNFWADYYPLFAQMYLNPMVKHWYNPGKFVEFYPQLLGGLDMNQQFQNLASCVSRTYETQPNLDYYPRPELQSSKS